MYRGATLVSLDSKGRITIPARYRELLLAQVKGQMVCTIDVHQCCLLLYPLSDWEIIEQRLAKLSSLQPQERRLQRLLLGYADEVQLDSAGRLLIAGSLRQHANLQKQVMLVGQLNKFELWDHQLWSEQIQVDLAAEQQDPTPLSQRLCDFSL
ncbi:MAG: division/cell wall cluster transcriptional repressor MraZ [Candidatus Symbiodolus clandestinus]